MCAITSATCVLGADRRGSSDAGLPSPKQRRHVTPACMFGAHARSHQQRLHLHRGIRAPSYATACAASTCATVLLQWRQEIRVTAVRASRMHKGLPARRPCCSRCACSEAPGGLHSITWLPLCLCSRPASAGHCRSSTTQSAQRQPVRKRAAAYIEPADPSTAGIATISVAVTLAENNQGLHISQQTWASQHAPHSSSDLVRP